MNNKKAWNDLVDGHVKLLKKNKIMYGLSIKDYMEFPIEWDRSIPLREFMSDLFNVYIEEIEPYYNNIGDIKCICKLITDIISILRSDDIEHSGCFKMFNELIGSLLDNCITCSTTLDNSQVYYRLRGDRLDLKKDSDFCHVPFSKPYLCASCRFSVPGFPALYLGYSESVCINEAGKAFGSMASFTLKDEVIEKICDLTFSNQKDLHKVDMFKMWPLLAACYVEVPKLVDEEIKCVRYKEEYLFPQAFASYLIKNMQCKGIIYYSVRNRFLSPTDKECNNVVLFTNHKDNGDYDFELLNKFSITNIHNINSD